MTPINDRQSARELYNSLREPILRYSSRRAIGHSFPKFDIDQRKICPLCNKRTDFIFGFTDFVIIFLGDMPYQICTNHADRYGKQGRDCTTDRIVKFRHPNQLRDFIQSLILNSAIGLRFFYFFAKWLWYWLGVEVGIRKRYKR